MARGRDARLRAFASALQSRAMPTPPTRIEQTLTLAVLAVLIAGCFLVLRPFLTAVLWAVVLAATTWPLHARIQAWLGGRPGVAAGTMTLLVAAVVIMPFVIVGVTLADNFDRMAEFAKRVVDQGPPDPPAWVAQLPLVGDTLQAYWGDLAHDTPRLLTELRKLVEPAKSALVSGGASVAQGLLQLTLSVLIMYFFLRDGDAATRRLRAAIERIAPTRGARLLDVAAGTTRGVVYGILGTALAQGVLTAIGLWIVGIGAAPLLGLVTFFLSPVPIGPPLVWIPAGAWLLSQGNNVAGIFLLLWGALVVSSIDNFLKPLIISRGSNLPFILVMLGILGGVVAFGFIGVFLGPVLLAIGLALLKEWAVLSDDGAQMPSEAQSLGDPSERKTP
jgi:predicted PurR-regulated permease PerM